MSLIEAIILGLLQGIAEFLPISSSGHLILIPWLTGFQLPDLTFGVFVHAGSMAGILIYFWREWWDMLKGGVTWIRTREVTASFRLLLLLIIGTIPAALVGVFLEDSIEMIFGKPLIVAIALIGTALVLFLGEKLGKGDEYPQSLTVVDAILIGIAQMIAIIPGLSRSGMTLTAGRLRRLNRAEAARFSFLLSVPVIAGAALIEIARFITQAEPLTNAAVLIAGFVSALIAAYVVIGWLLKYLKTRSTKVFSIYCLAFACLNIIVAIVRG